MFLRFEEPRKGNLCSAPWAMTNLVGTDYRAVACPSLSSLSTPAQLPILSTTASVCPTTDTAAPLHGRSHRMKTANQGPKRSGDELVFGVLLGLLDNDLHMTVGHFKGS